MNKTYEIPSEFIAKFKVFYLIPAFILIAVFKNGIPNIKEMILILISLLGFIFLLEWFIRNCFSKIRLSDEGIFQESKQKSTMIYWNDIVKFKSNIFMQRFTIKGTLGNKINIEYQTTDLDELIRTIAENSNLKDSILRVYRKAKKRGSIYKCDVDSFKN